MRAAVLLAFVLVAGPAFAQRTRPLPRSRSVSRSVQVDARRSAFAVDHVWEVTGATRAELMGARRHLRLSGPTGLFGSSALLRTATPQHLQNVSGHVDARGVRPFLLPWAELGSRARTRLTLDGFEASMSEGPIGRGTSRVVIGPTVLVGGIPVTTIRETGEYTLRLHVDGALAPLGWAWNLAAATPFGAMGMAPALYAMGELHNEVFDAGRALAAATEL
jgi:hypothetical protein